MANLNGPEPRDSSPPWSASLRLIGPLAAFKLFLLLLVYWSLILIPMPFNRESYHLNYHWPPDAPLTLQSAYETWDAQMYLTISGQGYEQVRLRNMHPLWPLVIHTVALVAGDRLTAALIAANLLSLAALILLHRLAMLKTDPASADAAVLLALAFPSAFFLSFPYSESLFLLLAVGLMLALRTDRPVWIWTLAALLPLTRAVGVVCAFPIVVDQCLKHRPIRGALLATGTLAGILLYFLIFQWVAGDPFAGLRATLETTRASTSNLLHPIGFIQQFFASGIELHGILNSAIDRAIFIMVLAALWPMIRRDPADAAYSIPAAIIPAMTQSMMSYSRYALVIFPVFIVGGRLLSPPRRRPWFCVLLAASFSLEIILLIRHVHWDWVG
jgi:hypothetical protein